MRTSVKYMVIYRHKEKYSICEMCRFFEVSRSGYYDYVKRIDIPAWDLPLAEKIRECQEHSHSTYGYRRAISALLCKFDGKFRKGGVLGGALSARRRHFIVTASRF